MEAARRVKAEGLQNDLLERISNDQAFGMSLDDINGVLKPENYIGRCPEQVDEYLNGTVIPFLNAGNVKDTGTELKV